MAASPSPRLTALTQWLWPRHLLARLAHGLVESERPWVKRALIRFFLRRHPVDLAESCLAQAEDYASFNAFFTRALKPGARPVCPLPGTLSAPVDGRVSACGTLEDTSLLQAKGRAYTLPALLAGAWPRNEHLRNGSYATFYLAPTDYHRVHAPLRSRLLHSTWLPGRLFSVNPAVVRAVPDLYARNERLVCEFESTLGRYVLVLVGAGFVSGIVTRWSGPMPRGARRSVTQAHAAERIEFAKGEEIAHFRMGSTVLLLLPPGAARWTDTLVPGASVRVGAACAMLLDPAESAA